MLEIENVTAGYGTLTALQDVSLHLASGARIGIFGHDGAGKTTLLSVIVGGLVARRAGHVRFDGVEIAQGRVPETVRRGIAFVPQGHNVFPNLSVERNLHVAGLLFDRGFVKEVFKVFPVLDERRSQRAGSLWGRTADAGAGHGADDAAEMAAAGRTPRPGWRR